MAKKKITKTFNIDASPSAKTFESRRISRFVSACDKVRKGNFSGPEEILACAAIINSVKKDCDFCKDKLLNSVSGFEGKLIDDGFDSLSVVTENGEAILCSKNVDVYSLFGEDLSTAEGREHAREACPELFNAVTRVVYQLDKAKLASLVESGVVEKNSFNKYDIKVKEIE